MQFGWRKLLLPFFLFFTVTICALFFKVSHAYAVPATYPERNLYMPDGDIDSEVYSNGILYVGGFFSNIGYYSAYGVVLNGTSAKHKIENPVLNGRVETAISDGNGGWYVGGDFTVVGTETHNRLAHINSDGTVDSNFNANINDTVYSIIKSGSTLYIGGGFGVVDGVTRKGIAAVSATDGSVTSFDPEVYNQFTSWWVNSMALSGNTLYAVGSFSFAGGQSRSGIAALDITTDTNNATAWNPTWTGGSSIQTVIVSSDGNTVYIGGDFTAVNGSTRNGIAAINASDGTTASWNPSLSSGAITNALVVDGSVMYIGGRFTTVGGTARKNLASVAVSDAALQSWDPEPDADVSNIAVSGSALYVIGSFSTISSTSRNGAASYDTSTGNISSWDPKIDDSSSIKGLGIDGTNVFLGGNFFLVNEVARNNAAAFDVSTGEPTSWNPNPDDKVSAVAADSSSIYLGGSFLHVDGAAHSRLVSVDKTTGLTVNWDANADNTVNRLFIDGNKLYTAGNFSTIGGQTRDWVARLNTSTGQADTWNPSPNSVVYAFLVNNGTLYLGGDFTSISGSTRNYIASYNTSDGSLTSWNPGADNDVEAFAVSGSTLYIGGIFTTIGGVTRNNIAAFDISGNATIPTAWDPDANGEVSKLYAVTDEVIAGGYFTSIGGSSQYELAALDTNTNTNNLLSWFPTLPFEGDVLDLAESATDLFIAYSAETVNNLNIWSWRLSEYAFNSTSSTPTPTPTSSSHATSSSSSGASSCTSLVPIGVPNLYQLFKNGSSVTLFFVPAVTNFDRYIISYGLSSQADQYNITFNSRMISGAQTYTINHLSPNTTYYFKVRAQNGCMPGVWSNTLSIYTTGSGFINNGLESGVFPANSSDTTTQIANVKLLYHSDTSVSVTWETSDLANSQVRYGTDPTQLNTLKKDSTKVRMHAATLQDLSPDTRYFYQISSQGKTKAVESVSSFIISDNVSPNSVPNVYPNIPITEIGSYSNSTSAVSNFETSSGEKSSTQSTNSSSNETSVFAPVMNGITLLASHANQAVIHSAVSLVQILPTGIKMPLFLSISTAKKEKTIKTVTKVSQFLALSIVTITVIPQLGVNLFSSIQLITDIPLYLIRLLIFLLELLHIRKKPKPWGVVFDAKNGQPIDPAIVSLTSLPVSVEHPDKTRITDIQGRFGFLVQKGLYALTVKKTDYAFPSKHLEGKLEAFGYTNLYFGKDLSVNDADVITVNIPMDPIRKNWNQEVKHKYYSPYREWINERTITKIMAITILINLVIYVLYPTVVNFIMFIIFLMLMLIHILLKSRKWGVVYNGNTKELLSNLVVRAMRVVDGNEIDSGSTLTDPQGRYYLLLFQGTGFLQVEKTMPDGSVKILKKTATMTIKNPAVQNFPNIKI